MKTVFEHIRTRLHEQAGVEKRDPLRDFLRLQRTEWSPYFERLMRNRLLMGALRYGCMHAAGKPDYDRVAGAIERLNRYKVDANKEHLVDVANICLLEFEEGKRSGAHFSATDNHLGCPVNSKT